MTVPPPASYDLDDDTAEPLEPAELAASADAGAPPVARVRKRSSGEAAAEWVEQNARALGTGAVIAAVAVAGLFAWRSSERATADRADRALYQAEARYVQGDPGAAQALQQVNARYGGTSAGAHARVLLAQANYDQGKYADGLRVLGGGSPPADWRDQTERMRAVGEEGAGRPKEAAAIYERLASEVGPDEKSSLLGDAARAYEAAGDQAAARRTWQSIIDAGRPGTADEARVRLGELNARGR